MDPFLPLEGNLYFSFAPHRHISSRTQPPKPPPPPLPACLRLLELHLSAPRHSVERLRGAPPGGLAVCSPSPPCPCCAPALSVARALPSPSALPSPPSLPTPRPRRSPARAHAGVIASPVRALPRCRGIPRPHLSLPSISPLPSPLLCSLLSLSVSMNPSYLVLVSMN